MYFQGAAASPTWQEYMLTIEGWWELRWEEKNQDCEELYMMCRKKVSTFS